MDSERATSSCEWMKREILAAIDLAEGLRALCAMGAARQLGDPPFVGMERLAVRMLGHLQRANAGETPGDAAPTGAGAA